MNASLEYILANKYTTEIELLYNMPYRKFIVERSQGLHRSQTRNRLDTIFLYLYILYEIYRTVVSVFLIAFVPYDCTNQDCTFQSLFIEKPMNATSMSISTATFVGFLILYSTEYLRECFLEKHLSIHMYDNTGIPGIHTYHEKHTLVSLELYINTHGSPTNTMTHPLYDNSLVTMLTANIIYFNKLVHRTSIVVVFLYTANVVIAFLALYTHNHYQHVYLIVFTNIALICPKLYVSLRKIKNGVLSTHSSYITDFIEFNDYNNDDRTTVGAFLQEGRLAFLQQKSELLENSMLELPEENEDI